jgi:DNA-binding MarR family transcriptional regulator
VTPATVTSAIDRLEAENLVRRIPHPSDARSTLAEITPRGRAIVAAATAELNARVFETVRLSPEEMDSLFRVLVKIRVEAGDFSPSRRDRGSVSRSELAEASPSA